MAVQCGVCGKDVGNAVRHMCIPKCGGAGGIGFAKTQAKFEPPENEALYQAFKQRLLAEVVAKQPDTSVYHTIADHGFDHETIVVGISIPLVDKQDSSQKES